jgi:hypothetical protein
MREPRHRGSAVIEVHAISGTDRERAQVRAARYRQAPARTATTDAPELNPSRQFDIARLSRVGDSKTRHLDQLTTDPNPSGRRGGEPGIDRASRDD